MLQVTALMGYFHLNVVIVEAPNIQQVIAHMEYFLQSVLIVEAQNIQQVIVHMEYSLQNVLTVVVRITVLPTVRRVCLQKETHHQDKKLQLHLHLLMKVAVRL
jgi:hypothetical protein